MVEAGVMVGCELLVLVVAKVILPAVGMTEEAQGCTCRLSA
jgi:hypothetical protein